MRSLLVSSQKGGVGKTTTAVNLAALAAAALADENGGRVLLLDADPLGSVATSLQLDRADADPAFLTDMACLWPEVLPNLDVTNPYPTDATSEDDLDAFLAELSGMADYEVVVIDAPPMLGRRPKALLHAAEEVLIVLRAEPMSFRTLPAYLDLVREVKSEGGSCRLRGILLTLPQGTVPGGSAEMGLRERFKGLLPQAVPFDPEVGRAMILGKPVVESSPRSVAAAQYRSLAVDLRLARNTNLAPKPELIAAAAGIASRITVSNDKITHTLDPVQPLRELIDPDMTAPLGTPKLTSDTHDGVSPIALGFLVMSLLAVTIAAIRLLV